MEAYDAASQRATSSTADLRKEFGAAANDAKKMLQEISEADLRAAERAARAAGDALQSQLQINAQRPEIGDQGRLADVFDLSLWSREARGQINSVLSAFRELGDANSLEAQIAAAQTLQARFKNVAEATGGISEAEDNVLAQLNQQIISMQRLVALREAAARTEAEGNGRAPGFDAINSFLAEENRLRSVATKDAEAKLEHLKAEADLQALIQTYGKGSAQVANFRTDAERAVSAEMVAQLNIAQSLKDALMAAWDAANPRRDAMAERTASMWDYYAASRVAGSEAAATAQAELDTLTQQNELRSAAVAFGRDSVEVALLQNAASIATYDAYLDTLDVAESVKEELRNAYDAGLALADLEMSGGIAGATAEARLLAATLGIALGTAIAIENAGKGSTKPAAKFGFGLPSASDPIMGGAPALGYGKNPGTPPASRDPNFNSYVPPLPKTVRAGSGSGAGSGGGRGSGTSEIEKQRQALDDLIEREERELELLRESDPVRQEMLRNREALAGATDVERAKVEELITTRIRETEAMERMEWVSQQTGNALIDALMGGANAGEQLIDTLKRASRQALILGEGPLAGLFGGGSGLLGGLFGGASAASDLATTPFAGLYADGGKIVAAGRPREDNIPIWVSNGEMIVNNPATAKYEPILTAMNAGANPRQILEMFGGASATSDLATTPFAGLYADGGKIVAAGGPREDNIPIWVSNGEMIVNNPATAKYEPILTAMNAGANPRQILEMFGMGAARAYADGGKIGPSASASLFRGLVGTGQDTGAVASGGGDSMNIAIDLRGAQGDKSIEEKAYKGVQAALDEYDRKRLPRRFQEMRRDPRSIG